MIFSLPIHTNPTSTLFCACPEYEYDIQHIVEIRYIYIYTYIQYEFHILHVRRRKKSVLDLLSEQSLVLDVCRKVWKLLGWTLKTNLILYSRLCILHCHQTLQTDTAFPNQYPDFEACKNYQGISGVLPGAHEVFMFVPSAFH